MHQFNPLTMKASIGEGHPAIEIRTSTATITSGTSWPYRVPQGDRRLRLPQGGASPSTRRTGASAKTRHRCSSICTGPWRSRRATWAARPAELLGWADWNDAFNMEGAESVFSACLYGKALLEMQDLMGFLGDGRSARGYAEDYARIRKNVNRERLGRRVVRQLHRQGRAAVRIEAERGRARSTYTPGWAVIAGFAPPERAARAMRSVKEQAGHRTRHQGHDAGLQGLRPCPASAHRPMRPASRRTAASSCIPIPGRPSPRAMLGNGDRAVPDTPIASCRSRRTPGRLRVPARRVSCRTWPATSIRNSASRAIPGSRARSPGSTRPLRSTSWASVPLSAD